jgi:hypothetical protein
MMGFRVDWKEPSPPATLDLPAVLRSLAEFPRKWALVRTCPTANAARQLKRRVVARLRAWDRLDQFVIAAEGPDLYMRTAR